MNDKLVFHETAMGNRVEFRAERTLANGVYLYVVTVPGAHGEEVVKSKISKLVVLK